MANLRDLRKRIRSVKNTQKITRAMKMVAASKLRRAQNAIIEARPYAIRMEEVLRDIVSRADVAGHPLLRVRVPKRVELVVMSSDRGLCGSFNSNIIRTADRWLRENQSRHELIQVSTIGRKVRDHFRRKGIRLTSEYDGILERLDYKSAGDVAFDLAERFRRGELDAIYLLYNEFKSAISQNVVLKQLLPIHPIEEEWEQLARVRVGELASVSKDVRAVAGRGADTHLDESPDWEISEEIHIGTDGYEHVFEPSRDAVLDALLPQHLAVQVWRALLESTAAEHGARMTAMDAATRNASELNQKLTLEANRLRQAGITTELMEIVTGAESLKAG
ncbi:MAG: ATP synthase F1 subunit gamma [Myxococcota bacterium]